MAARQIEPDARRARRQRVDELIGKLKEGIAQRALTGPGSLFGFDIDKLAYELEGMRRHIRRSLSAPEPNGLGSRQDAEVLEASLFPADHDAAREALEAWSKELKQMKLDRTVDRAMRIHFVIQRAREVLPEIEAARKAKWAREKEEAEAAFQTRVAEAKAAGKLRELSWQKVVELIQEAGHQAETYGSPATLYGQAVQLGVITDLECEVAYRRNPRGWHYAGD
jgi:hypothetical protein